MPQDDCKQDTDFSDFQLGGLVRLCLVIILCGNLIHHTGPDVGLTKINGVGVVNTLGLSILCNEIHRSVQTYSTF